MLLIFVVETNEKNDSDKMYISKYLTTRYPQVSLDSSIVVKWVYMNGKTNYSKKGVENKVKDYKSRYDKYHPGNNDVYVIYCIDIDDLSNKDCVRLNSEVIEYCKTKQYRLIWFNKTIEHVFLGKIIHQSKNKKKESKEFLTKRMTLKDCCNQDFNVEVFSETNIKKSNIGCILSELFEN